MFSFSRGSRLSFITGLVTNDWLSCDFESNHSCEWIDDANNWLANWRPTPYVIKGDDSVKEKHQLVLCTQLNPRTKSRLRYRPDQSSSLLQMNSTVRIISPPVTSLDSVKCFSFLYRFEKLLRLSSSPAHNKLLSVEPMHQCSFERNLCGWINDQSSWEGYWQITEIEVLLTNAACFHLTQKPINTENSWSVRRKTSHSVKSSDLIDFNRLISAKLWSPLIQAEDQLRCLVLLYKIDTLPSVHTNKIRSSSFSMQQASLALLKRQEG
ncbi:hypothetical protein KSF78_0000598 [Schistosoma japonicum]|nr:hypothetical protein KSF78_0000598 [Schistosoma japonicum]